MLSRKFLHFNLFLIVLLSSFSIANAQEDPEVKWKDGKKYIVHTIKKGETWSGISRKYNATIQSLQAVNPNSKELKFDQTILIPFEYYKNAGIVADTTKSKVVTNTTTAKIDSAKTKKVDPPNKTTVTDKNKKTTTTTTKVLPDTIRAYKETPRVHIVKAGETLYGIAAKYHMNFKDFAKLNYLTTTKVKIGQELKIPQYAKYVVYTDSLKPSELFTDTTRIILRSTVKTVRDSLILSLTDTLAPDSIKLVPGPDPILANPYEKFYFNNTSEQGVATWMFEASVATKKEKFYALHRTAPIGTIIKVVNPMNKRFVFVKVVGPLPDTGDNHDVMIKITQAAARRIGIIDSRFRVDISYGIKGKPMPSKKK